jgi:hypothetical protein
MSEVASTGGKIMLVDCRVSKRIQKLFNNGLECKFKEYRILFQAPAAACFFPGEQLPAATGVKQGFFETICSVKRSGNTE